MKVQLQPRSWLYLAVLILLIPALLINLGLLTFIDDEAIRSLVALEMKLSGNVVVPTMHGAFYYNKPPLYNWILLLFFQLSGQVNEWSARVPTVLCLLGYGTTLFYFFRRHYGPRIALLNALVLITCGRILFWDSMLGLIDICFSWVVFTNFMVIYHLGEKKRFLSLFLWSYLLTATGFLLKGLPALVFQAVTLLVYFLHIRQFWKLVSWRHISGILLLAITTGLYYYAYSRYNDLEVLFKTLFSESSKRTVVRFGWKETIWHFLSFPLEMVYHFLPWSLMIIYFFHRKVYSWIRKDPFIFFNLIAFLANILVYWTSPEVYPRYLLMLAPLIFSSFIYLHQIHESQKSWQFQLLDKLFLCIALLLPVVSLLPVFLERTRSVPFLGLKTGVLFIGFSVLAYLYLRMKTERIALVVAMLVVGRIAFDWFVLPDRNREDFGDQCRQTSIDAGKRFADYPFYVYDQTAMQPTNSFYLTQSRGKIIPRISEQKLPEGYYIVNPDQYPAFPMEKAGEIKVRHGRLTFDIGKLISTSE
ncbi:MAG TPA: glycosyltransferase family 39 protein [Flavilitoribacter sp.]|nr:glycosyltransferase family 39 protein [Flavilitoribacter sp.]HMQ85962.1 glycosyltransferase family 39 protein [Flavilitoribacter sp.]